MRFVVPTVEETLTRGSMGLVKLGVLVALALSFEVTDGPGADRLYGRVTTVDGDVVEGFLRWDRNESAPADFLDARREIPGELVHEAQRLDPDFAREQREARSLEAFGMRLTWDEDDLAEPPSFAVALRFSHIASLTVLDDRSASVELVDGTEVHLRGTSTDLGRSLRELVVERPGRPERTYRWRELERVEFLPVPTDAGEPEGTRIRGTVTTWSGLELTGTIAWDRDESLTTDILDGRADGEDVEIPFTDIAGIEWESDRASNVRLWSGEVLEVRGSNDVNRDNRGVEVADPAFGRAIVDWEDFKEVRFEAPQSSGRDPTSSASASWPVFRPGDTIRGTVYARDGRVLEGAIRWGNEETQLWESLEGWIGDTRFRVEFGTIASLRKTGEDELTVTLEDGRTLDLGNIHRADRMHDGVFIAPDTGPTRLVLWRDFDHLELAR